MKHTSWYGTTCWFCGHPTADGKGRFVQGVTYKICRPCAKVDIQAATPEAMREQLRAALNADVDKLQAHIRREPSGVLHYWTPYEFDQQLAAFRKLDPRYADRLRWKEYADEFAAATETRLKERMRVYKREGAKK